jgi:hypothetical protein
MVTMLQEWVEEERATEMSWILEEGTEEWVRLGDRFPEMFAKKIALPENPYAPLPLPIRDIPAHGLLDYFTDETDKLSLLEQLAHKAASEQIMQECQRSGGVVRLRGLRSLQVGDKLAFGESKRLPEEARPESVLLCALGWQTMEYYLIIPWSRIGRLPHEFVSMLPGRLPSSLALRRRSEDGFDGGRWVGICGTENDVLAMAARRSTEDLIRGLRWDWFSPDRSMMMTLVWGVQAVPLGDEKFLHLVQTCSMGPREADFGLLWYLERQSAFYRFARRLSLPLDHETHFLYSTCAGQLLARLIY